MLLLFKPREDVLSPFCSQPVQVKQGQLFKCLVETHTCSFLRVLFIYFFGLFFGTNVIKINNWSWFSQITSLPVILWYLSPISQDVQYHLRSRSKTGNTMFLRQYLGMNDMYFFQPLLITCIYRPHMVDIDKITNNFTFLYFRKKFMTCRRFTPGGRTA